MGVFDNVATDDSVKDEVDSLGGFQAVESDVYDCKIKDAFITHSTGKAMAMNLIAKTADGKEIQQQFWVTSGEAKGCKNYYTNQKTGDKHYLPGFNVANAICLLTVGKQLFSMPTEPGVADMYGEKATVDRIPGLIGKDITLGVIKQIVDKQAKNADTGDYENTGETRTENEVDKVFRTKDGLTVTEIRGRLTEPAFKAKWEEKWVGQTKDRSTGAAANGVTPGIPAAKRETGNAAPQEALFA